MRFTGDELDAYLLDELGPERRAALDKALHQSPEVRAALEERRTLMEALRSLPNAEPPKSLVLVDVPAARGDSLSAWLTWPRLAAAGAMAAVIAALWMANPTLSRQPGGWTLSVGSAEASASSADLEDRLRTAMREELARDDALLLQALEAASRASTDAAAARAEIDAVRVEVEAVHQDALAGHEFVMARHELLRRQLLEFDIAAIPGSQP